MAEHGEIDRGRPAADNRDPPPGEGGDGTIVGAVCQQRARQIGQLGGNMPIGIDPGGENDALDRDFAIVVEAQDESTGRPAQMLNRARVELRDHPLLELHAVIDEDFARHGQAEIGIGQPMLSAISAQRQAPLRIV